MKNTSIFEHEQNLLSRSKALLEQNTDTISSEDYDELISEYKRLLKTTSRLVRHNDRNEQRLNDLAKEANEKRQQLEGLSKQLSKKHTITVIDAKTMKKKRKARKQIK